VYEKKTCAPTRRSAREEARRNEGVCKREGARTRARDREGWGERESERKREKRTTKRGAARMRDMGKSERDCVEVTTTRTARRREREREKKREASRPQHACVKIYRHLCKHAYMHV